MKLKNKVEREKFLKNYKSWELFKEIPEIEVKLYRYTFPNGTVIIATEHARFVFDYENRKGSYKKVTAVKYHLILSETDEFINGHLFHEHKVYEPTGDSFTTIIKYLTVTGPEV